MELRCGTVSVIPFEYIEKIHWFLQIRWNFERHATTLLEASSESVINFDLPEDNSKIHCFQITANKKEVFLKWKIPTILLYVCFVRT